MDNPEVFKFFPIPIFKYSFEKFREFNDELSNYIYTLHEGDNIGIKRSNRGGWHSKTFEMKDKTQLSSSLQLSCKNTS